MSLLEDLLPVLVTGDQLCSLRRGPCQGDAFRLDGYGFSIREKEIAQLVCRGLRNGEIANLLGSSRFTVRNQIAAIFRKCDVSSRAELVYQLASQPGVRPLTGSSRDLMPGLESLRGIETEADPLAN